MAKTKREYILLTCFLSGAAAVLTFVSLGTQSWVVADARDTSGMSNSNEKDSIKIGLFGGVFQQTTAYDATFDLTIACAFDYNICAMLCGPHMVENLRKLYDGEYVSDDDRACARIPSTYGFEYAQHMSPRSAVSDAKPFINSGIWLSTVIFLIISGAMGVFSACLSLWNTVANPYQAYFSVFGLYIYNSIAFFSVLLSVALWGGMYAKDLIHNVPSYKTYVEPFTTDGYAHLGYSYWLNLVAVFLYMASVCVLYIRNYLISKEPKVNVHIEDTADPVIYLY